MKNLSIAAILLCSAASGAGTRLKDVAGRLKYIGRPKTLEEMNRAIAREVRARRERGRY